MSVFLSGGREDVHQRSMLSLHGVLGYAFVGPMKGEGYINSTFLLIPFFITPPLLWCFPKERQYLV
jgi:hypothetical protein